MRAIEAIRILELFNLSIFGNWASLKFQFYAYFMKSFIIYKEMESPYHKDAQSIIVMLYKAMKEENKLEAFQKIAEKYGINIKE